MITHTNLPKYSAVFGASLVLFLSTCWIMGISAYLNSALQSMVYFALALFCAHKAKDHKMTLHGIGCALVLGRIIAEVPIRIGDFRGTASTLIITLNVIVSIVLGLLVYREKRSVTFWLALTIIVLLNTICIKAWSDAYRFNFD